MEPIPIGINPKTHEPYKVMVVDDSKTIRMLLVQILQSENFKVIHEAENGLEAVNKLAWGGEHFPDILCMDVEMPVKTGIQALAEIRPKYPNLKIFMISAVKDKDVVTESLSQKVDGYIVKPFDRMKVLERIALSLGRKI